MKLTLEQAKSLLLSVSATLQTAKVLLDRAIARLRELEEAEIEEADFPHPAMVTGEIPIIKGSDMDGEGGDKVGTMDTRGFFERKVEVLKEAAGLNIHDSILKGDDA